MDLADLALRPLTEVDLDGVHLLAAPDAAGFNWAGHRSEVALRRRFAEDGYLGAEDGWLIAGTADGQVLASVGWHAVDWGRAPYSRAWSIGLTVTPEHRGRGVGTRAQQLLCDYLFGTTAVDRIEAVTNAANVAEQRALVAAGFTREGVLRQAEFRFGRRHDLWIYSRLRGEWTQPA